MRRKTSMSKKNKESPLDNKVYIVLVVVILCVVLFFVLWTREAFTCPDKTIEYGGKKYNILLSAPGSSNYAEYEVPTNNCVDDSGTAYGRTMCVYADQTQCFDQRLSNKDCGKDHKGDVRTFCKNDGLLSVEYDDDGSPLEYKKINDGFTLSGNSCYNNRGISLNSNMKNTSITAKNWKTCPTALTDDEAYCYMAQNTDLNLMSLKDAKTNWFKSGYKTRSKVCPTIVPASTGTATIYTYKDGVPDKTNGKTISSGRAPSEVISFCNNSGLSFYVELSENTGIAIKRYNKLPGMGIMETIITTTGTKVNLDNYTKLQSLYVFPTSPAQSITIYSEKNFQGTATKVECGMYPSGVKGLSDTNIGSIYIPYGMSICYWTGTGYILRQEYTWQGNKGDAYHSIEDSSALDISSMIVFPIGCRPW